MFYFSPRNLCSLSELFFLIYSHITSRCLCLFTSKNNIFFFFFGERATYVRKQNQTHSSSCSLWQLSLLLPFNSSILLPSEKYGAEALYFLKYVDTYWVLRILKNFSKSLTVTGNTLGCCKFRVGDYCKKAKAIPVFLITSGKLLLRLFCLSNSWRWLFLHQIE